MSKEPIRKSAPPTRKAGGGCCFNPAKTVPQAHNKSKTEPKSKTSPPRHTLKDFEKNRKQTNQTEPKLHGQVRKQHQGLEFEQHIREKSSSEQFEKMRMPSDKSTQNTSYKQSMSATSRKGPTCRPPNKKPISKCFSEINKSSANENQRPKTFSGGAFLPKMVKITKPPPDQIQKVQILSPYTPTPMNLRKICKANNNTSTTESCRQIPEITKRRTKSINNQQVESLSAETFISNSRARRQSSRSSESDMIDERYQESNSSQSNRNSPYIHLKMSKSDEAIDRKSSSFNNKFCKINYKQSQSRKPTISNTPPPLSIRPSSQFKPNYPKSTRGESGAKNVPVAEREREEKKDLQNLKNKLTDYLRYTDEIRSDVKNSGLKSIDIGSHGKAKSTYLQAADHCITSIEIDRIGTNSKGASYPRSVEGSIGQEQFSASDSNSSAEEQQQIRDPNFLTPDQQLEETDGSECFEEKTSSIISMGSEPEANPRLVFPTPMNDCFDSRLIDNYCNNQQMSNDYNNPNYMTTPFPSQTKENPCEECGLPLQYENLEYGLPSCIPSLLQGYYNAQNGGYPSQDFSTSNGLSSPLSQNSYQSYPTVFQPEHLEKSYNAAQGSNNIGPNLITNGISNHKRIENQPFGNPIVYLDSAVDRTNKLRGLFDTTSDLYSSSTCSSNYDQSLPPEVTDIPNFRPPFENVQPSLANPQLLTIKGRILFNQPQSPVPPGQTQNFPNRPNPTNSNYHPNTQNSSKRCLPFVKCASLPPPNQTATRHPQGAQAKGICIANAENDLYIKGTRGTATASIFNLEDPKNVAQNPDKFENINYTTRGEGTTSQRESKVSCVTKTICDPQGRLVTVIDQTTEQAGAQLTPEALEAFDDFKARLGEGFFLPSDQESQDGSSVYSEISCVEETLM